MIDGKKETERFKDIDFEAFGRRALDPGMSANEKIGFPEAFRDGLTNVIWSDFQLKLPRLAQRGAAILDIGCGCGPLPLKLMAEATRLQQHAVLNDHANMLAQLPEGGVKIAGRFPDCAEAVGAATPYGFDAIICYSVLQVVAAERNPFLFVDHALELLKPGGRLLLGDIPNVSKLRRFLSSDAGIAHHKEYMKTEDAPDVPPFALHKDRLDDGFVLGLLTHIRLAGFDAWIMPQPEALPLSTRREDIVIARP
ncbi:class I SAM-dependent methyltransferase [Aestuariivirga sp.]|uniref:class I SAM-dependent methyltransferase n=1 Tax=Aestuariivirga sp. TaxID=2650926 RepID=UPI0039E58EE1